MNPLRKVVRWGLVATVPGELLLVLCLASGAPIPGAALRTVELATLTLTAALTILLTADYRRHRRDALPRPAAALAAVRDTVPAAVRRLTVHELKLFTSFVRWLALPLRRKGPGGTPSHGVSAGALPVPYAAGQSFLIYGFLFASVVETVALALLIPWPPVHAVFLVLDIWGIYFVVALQASCVVRPHVIAADGALRLRYGVLLEIAVPAGQIARARLERRFPHGSGPVQLRDDGSLDLPVASQTTITVELTEPVRFVRPLGKEAEASVLRFYADEPRAAVAALTAHLSPPFAT